jgi:uncharacterized RDD family membrane protein YckC
MGMVFEDRLTLDTPEGVQLELTLAGVGSRSTAAIVDYLIQGAIFIALAIVFGWGLGVTSAGGAWGAAISVLLVFVVFNGYNVAFEVLASGRTPGKRWNGLRVVRESGAPVTLGASLVRNVMRIIDFLPGMYLVGMSSVIATAKNQRLGDLAGGTLVIRDRQPLPAEYRPSYLVQATTWDTGAIRPEELDAVTAFLARRYELTPSARRQVAAEFASRLRLRVGGLVDVADDELFLERLVASKRSQY